MVVTLTVSGNSGDILVGSGSRVEFSPGQKSTTVALTAVDDNIPENEESYTISLSVDHPSASLSGAVRQVVLQKNDVPVRFVQVRVYSANKFEKKKETEDIVVNRKK